MSKKIFIQEIGDLIDNEDIQLSPEALEYFEELKSKKSSSGEMTENGKKILMFIQDNYDKYNNVLKAKDIGEGLSISGHSVSGSIRKLITDGYVEKIGKDPVSYGITELGKVYKFDK